MPSACEKGLFRIIANGVDEGTHTRSSRPEGREPAGSTGDLLRRPCSLLGAARPPHTSVVHWSIWDRASQEEPYLNQEAPTTPRKTQLAQEALGAPAVPLCLQKTLQHLTWGGPTLPCGPSPHPHRESGLRAQGVRAQSHPSAHNPPPDRGPQPHSGDPTLKRKPREAAVWLRV